MATTTYKTANLKADIDKHEIRIIKLEQNSECLNDHLQRHTDVFDPLLKKHDRTLYGEHGDDGLVHDMKQLVNDVKQITNTNTQIKKNVTELTLAVVSAIIIQIIMQIFK